MRIQKLNSKPTILLLFLLSGLMSCVSQDENIPNVSQTSIIGSWKNLNQIDAGIEFSSAGEYYVLKDGERYGDLKATYEILQEGNNPNLVLTLSLEGITKQLNNGNLEDFSETGSMIRKADLQFISKDILEMKLYSTQGTIVERKVTYQKIN